MVQKRLWTADLEDKTGQFSGSFYTEETDYDWSMSLTKADIEISIIWHSLPPVSLATGASGDWLENAIY